MEPNTPTATTATTPVQPPLSHEQIPVARPDDAPIAATAQKRPSMTRLIMLVFLIILALLAYRNRDYIRFELIPRIERYIALQYNGAVASPAPKNSTAVAAFTQSTILNHVISYDSRGILVSRPDGTGTRRLVESTDPVRLITTSKAGDSIYYSILSNNTQSVYEKSLATGRSKRLLTFQVSGQNIDWYDTNVAIDANLTHIAFSHDNGSLSLYDIAKNERRLLQKQITCKANEQEATTASAISGACQAFYKPAWSPDAQIIAVHKLVHEGEITTLLYPFEPESTPLELPVGGPTFAWMDSSSAMIVAGAYENLYYVGTFSASTATDLLRATFGSTFPVRVDSFRVFQNQYIALTFTPIQAADAQSRLALYDIRTQKVRPLLTAEMGQEIEVLQWINDTEIFYRTHSASKQHIYATYNIKTNASRTIPIVGNSPHYILEMSK